MATKASYATRACLAALALLAALTGCTSDPRVAAKHAVETGNRYFDRAKFKEASIMYRRALAKDRKCADAWYRLGLTNLRLSNPTDAYKDFSQAVDLDPANTDALLQLGNVDLLFYAANPQNNKRFLADLKDVIERLFRRNPKSFDGLRFSGELALIRNQIDNAIEKFDQANQAKPYQPDVALELVQTLFVARQDQRAESIARDLVAHQKTCGRMYDLLYIHYLRSNRAADAEDILKQKVTNNPSDGGYLLQLAFHYYSAGRKPDMEDAIARLLSDRKTFPDARLQLGDFFVRLGDFPRALEQFQGGKSENATLRRACDKKIVELLATEGKISDASALLAGLLKEDPKDPEAVGLHATLLLQRSGKNQAKAALAELQPLARKIPDNKLVHYNLGRAYMATGDPSSLAQAAIQFEQALKLDPSYIPAMLSAAELAFLRGDNTAALESAEAALRKDPVNSDARLDRAHAWMNTGRRAEAREELSLILQVHPRSVEARYQLARLDFTERRFPAAEAGFRAAFDTGDARGFDGIVESKIQQALWDQAVEFIRGVLSRAPDRLDYAAALANISFQAGRFDQAAAEYRSLVARQPKAAALYIRLGESEAQLGHADTAAQAFRHAAQLAPADPAPPLDLAVLLDRQGKADDARRAYEDALKIQPDNATALNNLAFLDADNGANLDQALGYAQRARDKRPQDPDVLDTLGFIYIQKNLNAEGLRILRDLVTQNPVNATYRFHLALALYQTGDRPAARKNLEAALRAKPGIREQGKIKALLAKVG